MNRCNKRIIIGTEASKKKRKSFMVRKELIDRSKSVDEMGESMIVISNGRITLAESCKLIMDTHGSGSRLRNEHALESVPHFTRCGALDHIS